MICYICKELFLFRSGFNIFKYYKKDVMLFNRDPANELERLDSIESL